MQKEDTSERIIDAAVSLISQKGYKAATTRAIADLAGVNEVTIFRNFGNKRGLIQAIVQKFSYAPLLQKMMREDVSWELETDLVRFSLDYQKFMTSIQEYVLISFREAGAFPEIEEEIAQIPLVIKEELLTYFSNMQKKGKIIDVDLEAAVMSLIHVNFGYFAAHARLGERVTKKSMENLIKTSMSIFSRGLTP